ncbi:MAG: CBS domain-containing protein [Candidatus Competibacteraceae bacterium]|jgi:CBS domain-containing protein|nr:CBS domain-containing protein [Candidatus Competibacteraceae bacterium]
MSKAFKPLSFNTLEYSVGYFRPRHELPDRVRDTSPALDVMTDLRQVAVLMVSPTTPLNMALERMIKSGVRMLLVTDANGRVLGLITSRDVQGEKPTKILQKTGGTLKDLVVGDIMTLKNKLEVLMMKDVLHARVGDIIATLKEVDRQHAIVVDTDPHNGELAVRGIFSLSQIGQQLGLQIDPTQRATTFEDLEWAVQHTPKP